MVTTVEAVVLVKSKSFPGKGFSSTKYSRPVLLESQYSQFYSGLQLHGLLIFRLTYQITDGNQDKSFELRTTNNVADIWTTKELDRETVSQYNLVVVAQDAANKCHKSRTLVVVNVEDENDNSPRFTENLYKADIKENAQSGTVVKTVRATDKDSGLNAQITYSITSGNPGNLFRINSGGQVILQGLLDYETTRSYRLHIRAQDGGNPSKSGFTYLQITVIDVNESPSISCVGSCSFTVSEAVVSGTKVGGLKASDPDTQSNCALRYDIPSNAQNTFQVNANGDIQTRKGLDRESVAQYDFFVRVRDCASPPLSASVRVTVVIEDVNDNSPTFTGPYRVNILENEASGSDVVQVKANGKFVNDNESFSMPCCISWLLFTPLVQWRNKSISREGLLTGTQ